MIWHTWLKYQLYNVPFIIAVWRCLLLPFIHREMRLSTEDTSLAFGGRSVLSIITPKQLHSRLIKTAVPLFKKMSKHICILKFTESVSWSPCWHGLSLQNDRNKRQGAWVHQTRIVMQCETSPSFCQGECLWDHAAELRHQPGSERQAVSSLVVRPLG